MNAHWHLRYLEMARLVSTWSKDPRKQVGAVITDCQYVRGVGFNGFPRGVEDDAWRWEDRETKLQLVVHAEVNAILAARGIGDTIYVWPQLPCSQCAGLIIQAGIKTVVTAIESQYQESSWNKDLVQSVLSQAGVSVVFI